MKAQKGKAAVLTKIPGKPAGLKIGVTKGKPKGKVKEAYK
jgi:hypothetical protein